MTLFDTNDPDIFHAHVCVVNALFEIPETTGTIFSVADDQQYLAAMVRQNHERNENALRHAAILAAAAELNADWYEMEEAA